MKPEPGAQKFGDRLSLCKLWEVRALSNSEAKQGLLCPSTPESSPKLVLCRVFGGGGGLTTGMSLFPPFLPTCPCHQEPGRSLRPLPGLSAGCFEPTAELLRMIPAGTIRERSEHKAVIRVTSGLHPQLCFDVLMKRRAP